MFPSVFITKLCRAKSQHRRDPLFFDCITFGCLCGSSMPIHVISPVFGLCGLYIFFVRSNDPNKKASICDYKLSAISLNPLSKCQSTFINCRKCLCGTSTTVDYYCHKYVWFSNVAAIDCISQQKENAHE